jgi:uracil-DNA glycosylase
VTDLPGLLRRVRACTLCAAQLPLGARPVLRASATARVLIIGQAPGTKVHASGVPWDDRSGDRLRAWLGLDRDAFYDESRIAIVPMGFCYPGKAGSGDAPPRRECAAAWHAPLLAAMPDIRLTLLVGQYAQRHYLGTTDLTATVRDWRAYAPRFVPLPHPSPRNVAWFVRNPWFDADVLPDLRARLRYALAQ